MVDDENGVVEFDHYPVKPGSTYFYEVRVRSGAWMQTRQGSNFL